MYKFITLTAVSIFMCLALKAQTIVISNNCTSPIDTPGDLIINPPIPGGLIQLKEVTIKCNSILFGPNASAVQIAGKVSITCNSVTFNPNVSSLRIDGKLSVNCSGIITMPPSAPASNISISGTNGSLSFDYPAGAFPTTRSFELASGAKVRLDFIQH